MIVEQTWISSLATKTMEFGGVQNGAFKNNFQKPLLKFHSQV